MARFDVYPTPVLEDKASTPFWLDIQGDHLRELSTRVVVPMRRVRANARLKDRLNPVFVVAGVEVFADMANLAAFPVRFLRQPSATLREHSLAIQDALDFLFHGY